MPVFDTPEPISAVIEISVGDVRVVATDRTDTVVDVQPSDRGHEPDVRAAEQTRIECVHGQLLVKSPRQRNFGLFGKPASIEVTVELPTGSQLRGSAEVAAFRVTGRVGECRIKTSAGELQLEETGRLDLHTSIGAVSVDRADGNTEITTGTGRVRIGQVQGSAVVKNSNGETWIGEVAGPLRVNAANGEIRVDRAGDGVTASAANGDIRIGAVRRGSSSLHTARGAIELGIPEGCAARLDAVTKFGRLINRLETGEGPGPSAEPLEIHARTGFGDIVVQRAH